MVVLRWRRNPLRRLRDVCRTQGSFFDRGARGLHPLRKCGSVAAEAGDGVATMRIAEIFHSLQGEGELTGIPSVFVRTSGCNLRCSWCDTKYASWQPEGEQVAIEEIVRRVLQHGSKHVVLTGGEPMIAADIHDLAAQLHREGMHITIETAGTVPPDEIACDLASLSPKMSNSTPEATLAGKEWPRRHDARRWQPGTARSW